MQKGDEKLSQTHYKKEGQDDNNYWKLLETLRYKSLLDRKSEKKVATTNLQDLGSGSSDEAQIKIFSLKGISY